MVEMKYPMHFLDITGETCPLTFVRTKICMKRIASGEILEIRLKAGTALRNVPYGLRELGHEVIEIVAEVSDQPDEIYRLMVRKC